MGVTKAMESVPAFTPERARNVAAALLAAGAVRGTFVRCGFATVISIGLFRIGIFDADMVHGGKLAREHPRHGIDLAQRERALVKLPVDEFVVDDLADHVADPVGRVLVQRAGGAFDGVRQHDDRGLTGLRLRPEIAVVLLVHRFRFLLDQRLLVKIMDQAGAMVLLDKIDQLRAQLGPARDVDPFLDVVEDHQAAHRRLKVVVLVVRHHLVLGEILGLHQFADVMVIGADPHQKRVRADGIRRGPRQVTEDQAVMVRARRFESEAFQQGLRERIRKLQQAEIRQFTEKRFKDLERRQDRRRGQKAAGKERLQAVEQKLSGKYRMHQEIANGLYRAQQESGEKDRAAGPRAADGVSPGQPADKNNDAIIQRHADHKAQDRGRHERHRERQLEVIEQQHGQHGHARHGDGVRRKMQELDHVMPRDDNDRQKEPEVQEAFGVKMPEKSQMAPVKGHKQRDEQRKPGHHAVAEQNEKENTCRDDAVGGFIYDSGHKLQ